MKWTRLTRLIQSGPTHCLRRLPPQWPSLVLTIVFCDAMLRIVTSLDSPERSFLAERGSPSPTRTISVAISQPPMQSSVIQGTQPTRLTSDISASEAMSFGYNSTFGESGMKGSLSATSSPLSSGGPQGAKIVPRMDLGLPPERVSSSGLKEIPKTRP